MAMLTFIGHSAFMLEADEHQVLIDPFITGNPRATYVGSDFSPQTILITHAHNDHVGDAPDISVRTGATVITVVELADYLEGHGASVIPANIGGTIEFQGGTVKFVPAWHSSSLTLKDGASVAPGTPSGLVVRFGGSTLYFAGDTALFSDMKLIGEEGIDIAVLPIGDHFTMGIDDAVRAVKFIEPSVVIPCHYNTFGFIEQDATAFKSKVERDTDARCEVIDPGGTYEF